MARGAKSDDPWQLRQKAARPAATTKKKLARKPTCLSLVYLTHGYPVHFALSQGFEKLFQDILTETGLACRKERPTLDQLYYQAEPEVFYVAGQLKAQGERVNLAKMIEEFREFWADITDMAENPGSDD